MSTSQPRAASAPGRGAFWSAAVAAALAGACQSSGRPARDPDLDVSAIRIIGSNCAGVAPVMTSDDGKAYAAQSVLAHYYAVLELYRVLVGDRPAFQTDVPEDLRGDVAYRTWQAKTVEILADVGETGFADRWYEGTFGMVAVGEAGPTCEKADPPSYQRTGLLAHTGLLQSGQCGENSDGDPRFWEVRPIALLWIGDVFDVDGLVDAGLAAPVTSDDHGACLVWKSGAGRDDGGCEIAYRTEAVTEAVVLDLSSADVVAGVPVMRRAFTARGEVPLPHGLDEARRVLRSDQFAAAVALGQPDFAYAGTRVDTDGHLHHMVRLVGHRAGPRRTPNSLLRDEERQQIEGLVGRWDERCCAVGCAPPDGGVPPGGPDGGGGPWPGTDGGSIPGRDGGGPPPFPLDAGVGEPGDAGIDPEPLPDAGVDPWLDGGAARAFGAGCDTACQPEGVCESGYLGDGLVVVVTDRTIAECGGDCPHPAADPPGEQPPCAE
ncbi:MAG TPA: hypothetical protein VK698_28000 [Kofleriaceae bacterium]|nr:hypothetical protein [Kofleriaceae bacterium]